MAVKDIVSKPAPRRNSVVVVHQDPLEAGHICLHNEKRCSK
jgi:hypothetical protein